MDKVRYPYPGATEEGAYEWLEQVYRSRTEKSKR